MADYKPYIPASNTTTPEFNFGTVIAGVILGILFGASSLYLALKVGMTVSASIPVAVMSITLFRALSSMFGLRRTTILENNIVQTTGSAGESLAFGVAVTMPALLIMGTEMTIERTTMIAVLGGLLGILMMIPLRRVLIVKEHGNLTYPEGTACAEVLMVGEKGGTSAATVFTGFFIGLIYKVMNVGMHLWSEVARKSLSFFKGASLGVEVSPELLGVGYIVGPRIASIMMGGGVLSALVLTPLIAMFGSGLAEPIFPATKLIGKMSEMEIWRNYILYIGAGAVAAGGIISLFQSLPTIYRGAIGGLGDLSKMGMGPEDGSSGERKKSGPLAGILRTDLDLPMKFVGIGILAIILVISIIPSLHMSLLGAILIIAFGFLFVTVSSRLCGTNGSSTNPISGMTVATLLTTCLIFLAMGWVSAEDRVTALTVAAIVCVAAAVGGTTSQDLKTGFLVGATPKWQQISILIGSFCSALVIGYVLQLLNQASTVYTNKNLPAITITDKSILKEKEFIKGPEASADSNEYWVLRVTEVADIGQLAGLVPGKYLVKEDGTLAYLVDPGINGTVRTRDDGTPVQKYEAPKARLMSMIVDGILTQKLQWGLVLLGVFIAVVLELCGISSLPFAVGVYLPIAISTAVFSGGCLRWLADKWASRGGTKPADQDSDAAPGVLLSSGLIAGGAIAGIAIALISMNESVAKALNFGHSFSLSESPGFAVLLFGALGLFVTLVGAKKVLK